MTFNLILLLIFWYPEYFQDIYSACCATLARYEGGRNLMSRHTPSCRHTHGCQKTSWNKTTDSRSAFTGYTGSCETEVEIQIGLTRRVQRLPNPSVEITRLSFHKFCFASKSRRNGQYLHLYCPKSAKDTAIYETAQEETSSTVMIVHHCIWLDVEKKDNGQKIAVVGCSESFGKSFPSSS